MTSFLLGPRLTTYVAILYARWVAVFMAVFFVLISLFDMAETVRRASSKEISFGKILQIVLLHVPFLMEQVLPFIMLFATLMTLWRLNKSQEIVILKSTGRSTLQILSPLLLTAFLVGGFDVVIFNTWSARMMERYEKINHHLFQGAQDQLVVSETGLWLRDRVEDRPAIIRLGRVLPQEKRLEEVSLIMYSAQDAFLNRIEAPSATLSETGQLILHNAWEQGATGLPQQHAQLTFSSRLTFERLLEGGHAPYTLAFTQLLAHANMLKEAGLSSHKYILHWASLWARWAWLVAMVVLAASFAMRPLRQGGTFKLMVSGLGVAFALYFLKDITYALGSSHSLPVVMAVSIPVLLSFIAGTWALLHTEQG